MTDGSSPPATRVYAQLLAAIGAAALGIYLASSRKTASRPHFPPPPFILRSSRVLLPDGNIVPADVFVNAAGFIAAVGTAGKQPDSPSSVPVVDVTPLLVQPGLVDPHVHINSPGKTHWEGFSSASRAAASGGTTTILDMPLNSVPATVSLPTLLEKLRALAESSVVCDVGFIGGAIPGNAEDLPELYSAGVLAFKSFMVDSQSADFPRVSLDDLLVAMRLLGELKRQTLAVAAGSDDSAGALFFPPYILHAELPPEGHEVSAPYPGSSQSFQDYLASRPESWEVDAVNIVLEYIEQTGCQVHIAHMSSADAVDRVAAFAKASSLVSAETCPHYLIWSSDSIPDAHPGYKCSPPIRSDANKARLWAHLGDTLSIVGSDHSPTEPALKRRASGDVRGAWGGISGLQYRLQATWTAMLRLDASASSLDTLLARAAHVLSTAPARQFGLGGIKGRIAPGAHADLLVWDPDATSVIAEEDCLHRHQWSPYVGMNLTGVVHWTLVRGRVAFAGKQDASADVVSAVGCVLRRDPAGGPGGVLVQTPAEVVDALVAGE
jgi:allantoinase